ncbi:MAG: hypothetical protein IPI39_16745 [Candidatus Obscuribacter sp.]|nr:hypothetical protein [Candidatus Obscuribacter sp.]
MFEKVVVTVIAIIFGVTANHFVFSGLARLSVNATYFGITICIVGGGLAMGLLDIARVNDPQNARSLLPDHGRQRCLHAVRCLAPGHHGLAYLPATHIMPMACLDAVHRYFYQKKKPLPLYA